MTQLTNKSINLKDGSVVKVGDPIYYLPLNKVLTLERCNRDKKIVKVVEFDFIQQSIFFRGVKL